MGWNLKARMECFIKSLVGIEKIDDGTWEENIEKSGINNGMVWDGI